MDHTTPKLLEFLRRRHIDDETRSFPILPLILLVPEDAELETMSTVRSSTGVDVLLQHPYTAKQVFEAIIGVTSRIHAVQNIYSDIHKFKESRKYTHLPLFDDNTEEHVATEQSIQLPDRTLPKVLEGSDEDEEEDASGIASEVDIESTCSDVVPEFLLSLRSEKHFNKTRNFDIVKDPKELANLDSQIIKSFRESIGLVCLYLVYSIDMY